MDVPKTVIIAPDSFKGSLAAPGVAAALARGWASVRGDDTLILLPQADGGEGTLEAIAAAVPQSEWRDAGPDLATGGAAAAGRTAPPGTVPTLPTTGAIDRRSRGLWLELPDRIGVIELAQSCGLPLLTRPDPLGASTFALGQVIVAALAAGTRSLIIGLGGSASTDGGAGALQALGLDLLTSAGTPIAQGGGSLADLHAVQRHRMLPPPPDGVTLLTDVTAPLLGATGAAAVFSPQKGASPADVNALEAGLARLSALLGGDPDAPGAGAAGGTAYGLATVWGASIRPGAQHIQQLSGLPAALGAADVVITGEGRYDATSSTGKVVGELEALAASRGVAVGIIAGTIGADVSKAGDWGVSLIELAGSSAEAIARPVPYLERAGRLAAERFGRG